MPEVRFKPADVGSVADGVITNAKVNVSAMIAMSKLTLAITNDEVAAAADIAKNKLGALNIVDADIMASGISVDKVDGAIKGRAADTSGDKTINALGWDGATEEVIMDHES